MVFPDLLELGIPLDIPLDENGDPDIGNIGKIIRHYRRKITYVDCEGQKRTWSQRDLARAMEVLQMFLGNKARC